MITRPDNLVPEQQIDWLAQRYLNDPYRDRSLDRYVRDPMVMGWLKDYWSYVCWVEHGNEPSVFELDFGAMLADITGIDIDYQVDMYLTNDLPRSRWDEAQRQLIDRRMRIQRRMKL